MGRAASGMTMGEEAERQGLSEQQTRPRRQTHQKVMGPQRPLGLGVTQSDTGQGQEWRGWHSHGWKRKTFQAPPLERDRTCREGLWLFWENQPCFGYVKRWRVERGICKEGWGCRSFFMQRRRLRQEGGEEARTSLDRLQCSPSVAGSQCATLDSHKEGLPLNRPWEQSSQQEGRVGPGRERAESWSMLLRVGRVQKQY